MHSAALIILDRDGVLNHMVVDPEHGTVDSPLHPDQVRICNDVPDALRILRGLGFKLAIATNQPAAAKGKTTMENLRAVHSRVLNLVDDRNALQLNSYICWHRKEDNCECRKPQVGLLLQALKDASADSSRSWMVGDGVTDILAGKAVGVKTVFIGPRKTDVCQIFHEHNVEPDVWCSSLADFATRMANK
jgi:histidinol-phosphate phosphatase family protein